MKNEFRLNPFVYISETDIRFYLLVLIGIIYPATTFLIVWVSLVFFLIDIQMSFFIKLFFSIAIFSFIPILIYWNYRNSSNKIIEKNKLKRFDKPEYCECIDKLHSKYFSSSKKPKLMYNYNLTYPFTFGTINQCYIGLSGGLIKKFSSNKKSFKTILLHEFAHIFNEDIYKIYLVHSMWRVLFILIFIPFGILIFGFYLIKVIYLLFTVLYFILGDPLDKINIVEFFFGNRERDSISIVFMIYFFLLIVYILKNQMIRLRELYADAKTIEWEESSENIIASLEEIKTLKINNKEKHSRFKILKEFHPTVEERLKVVKNNFELFSPSLLVAFAIGWIGNGISLGLYLIKDFIIFEKLLLSNDLDLKFFAFTSFFIISLLMLVVSSSFHKLTLNEVFNNNRKYISFFTILNTAKYSMIYSFGWVIFPYFWGYITLEGFLNNFDVWIFSTYKFFIVLFFLTIFTPILIRMSFTKKEAKKNFLIINTLFSLFYFFSLFYYYIFDIFLFSNYVIDNMLIPIIFFIIFSVITYTFIMMKYAKLFCPGCGKKMDISTLQLNCPHCQKDLYSWAIYPFS